MMETYGKYWKVIGRSLHFEASLWKLGFRLSFGTFQVILSCIENGGPKKRGTVNSDVICIWHRVNCTYNLSNVLMMVYLFEDIFMMTFM